LKKQKSSARVISRHDEKAVSFERTVFSVRGRCLPKKKKDQNPVPTFVVKEKALRKKKKKSKRHGDGPVARPAYLTKDGPGELGQRNGTGRSRKPM